MTKFTSVKFGEKMLFCQLYHVENSKTSANSVDPDEVAHYEPPHLNLRSLQIQQFLSLEL